MKNSLTRHTVEKILMSNQNWINLTFGQRLVLVLGGYKDLNYALLWFLNYADGRDLLDIATVSGQPLGLLAKVAKICEECGLVKRT